MYVVGHCKITNIFPVFFLFSSNPFHQPQYRCKGSLLYVITHTETLTVGTTPLDEWSARGRSSTYITQRDKHLHSQRGFVFVRASFYFFRSILSIHCVPLHPFSLVTYYSTTQTQTQTSMHLRDSKLSYLSLTYSAISEYKNSCPQRDSNPRSPQSRVYRPKPQTARSLGWELFLYVRK